MQVTSIGFSGSSLSLTYDKINKVLTGNTFFTVSCYDIGDEPANNFYVSCFSDNIFDFNPSSVNAPTPKKITVKIEESNFDLAIGNYTYELTLSNAFAMDLVVPIFLNVIEGEDPGGGVVPRDYKLKYYLENEPIAGEVFRCEIHEDHYVGNAISIEGRCELKYQDKSDHFQPISASSIELKLIANTAISLQDLYSEEEQHFKVYLKRNDQIIFVGFLKPDGIFEDYVSDIWELTIDAFDGLSTLKNISFSGDNGTPFSGRFKAFDIIYNCLKKTGLDLPINVNCRVWYEDTPGSFNTFETFYLNTDRYYQSGSDPMDCESVLKSILQLFNATLIQHTGEWFIYRSIDLDTSVIFNRYIDGIFDKALSVYPTITIGSQINNHQVFHCNGNQKKSISPSVQAYRVTYQYGNANSVYVNSELKLSGSGLDIPGWQVHNVDGMVERLSSGFGLTSKTFTGDSDPLLINLAQSIDINEGAVIKMIIRFANENINSVGLRFAIMVGNKYFNVDSGEWQNDGKINFIANYSFEGWYPEGTKKCKGLGDATYELVVKAPISGNLGVSIYRDRHRAGAGDFKIYSVNVVPNDSGNIKGREYTAQRTKKISTVTKPNITLYNGDSVSDLFVGTIYKIDADTPTDKWYRPLDPSSELKELLSINAEDNLRLSPRPMIIFEGDVYGFIPFLSLITIDQVSINKFQPTSYSFDTSTGIMRLTSREYSSAYLESSDFRIDIKDNYGNETKVTIV